MKLSVVIPAYNAEKYLKKCLNSIIEQDEANQIEIIVVNDGSKDSTVEICKEYAEKYSFFRYIDKKNEGVSVARNEALQQACGEWITFLDADDMFQENAMKCLANVWDSDADVIVCNYSDRKISNNTNDAPQIVQLSKALILEGILNLPTKIEEIKKVANEFDGTINWTCWGKLFRTQIIKEYSILFPKGITHGEDLLFCYNLYTHVRNIYYCPICLYYYRVNEESVSRTFNSKRIENTFKLFDYFIELNANIVDDINFKYFVVDRIIACLRLYFSDVNNLATQDEKIKELEEIMQIKYVANAIKDCPIKKLSVGKKTNILYCLILGLLKMKMYKSAMKIAKI